MRELTGAYRTVIPPLMTLAESQSFAANWDYDRTIAAADETQNPLF